MKVRDLSEDFLDSTIRSIATIEIFKFAIEIKLFDLKMVSYCC
jgi:hypothetical protein